MRLDPRHGPMLLALTDVCELTWCTTWNDEANTEIGPRIGLPDLPVLHLTRPDDADVVPRPGGLFWKLPQVLAAMGERPFAWLDDEVSRRERAAVGARDALIRFVDPGVGLRQADLNAVRAWAIGLDPH